MVVLIEGCSFGASFFFILSTYIHEVDQYFTLRIFNTNLATLECFQWSDPRTQSYRGFVPNPGLPSRIIQDLVSVSQDYELLLGPAQLHSSLLCSRSSVEPAATLERGA